MNHLITLSLVALGVVSAILLTSSNLFAQNSDLIDSSRPTGYCHPADAVCGTTDAGFNARGIYITM